ncbi:MAG: class I SAM-dependent methyltransferase [Deltaproteobacteria bacterium]|nr:class I SAM-dependent methyltransferase [Deltaproteobacteria bacterium]
MARESVNQDLRDLAYEVLARSSRDFLMQSGLSEGMHVLEVGCGAGAMTPWLAQTVGANGSVTALDVDPRALEMTRARVRSLGSGNVEYVLKPVQEIASLRKSFDLIYCRFVLMQFQEPAEIVGRLVASLNTKGILALDEPDQEADLAMPPCPPCAAANRVFLDYAERAGMTVQIGKLLFPILRQLGLEIVFAEVRQPIISLRLGLQMFKHGLLDSAPSLVRAGVIDDHGLDELLESLEVWPSLPGDYYALSRQFQVSGRLSS